MGTDKDTAFESSASSNEAIYLAALELADESERRAFLDGACGGDVERRRQIERLLPAGERGAVGPLDRVLEQLGPPPTRAAQLETSAEFDFDAPAIDVATHPMIDRYKLLEQIGEGGMGVVFMAQQIQPVKRRVALKLIKPGMDSREVIARFEAERQALAMMDHPNIARVFDAGSTAEGRPYFVMELVRGVPITDYCDHEKLAIATRLQLLIDVCHAVQHAHQKGVIHRDLKPSNVMITLHDAIPIVKVIDFGVAKALNQELSERTLFTQFAQMIGTPLYMSPEQAEMSGLDVDTRSDIYSLGVLLYELLTGSTPFDKETIAKAGIDAMRRMICEVEPARPSQKISTLEARLLSTVSLRRKTDPRQLSVSMKRELDWITMKALEKDRNRRYETANAFADDLQHFLNDEPVEACPPSAAYRLRKLSRRYKGTLGAAALVLFLLVIGLGVASRLAIRASKAEFAARTTTEEMRNLLYASDVMLASQSWQQDDVQQARHRLARHIPQPEQRDLRGFEWHFLWKQQEVGGTQIANLDAAIYDLGLSPKGKWLAVTGADAMIRLVDVATGELRLSLPTGQGETNGIDFSPDASRIAATGDDGTLRVFDVKTQREVWSTTAHEGMAFQVRYTRSGKLLATCGQDHHVRLWDASNGMSMGTLNQHDEAVETIAMSPDNLVAAGDRSSRVTLWKVRPPAEVAHLNFRRLGPISSIDFSDHGYLAHGTIGGLLTVVNSTERTVVSQRQLADGIQSLAYAPLGAWLAVGDRAGQLRIVTFEHGVWDLRASRNWPAHHGRIYAVEVAADGKRIFSGGADGRLMAWRPFDGTSEQVVNFGVEVIDVRALPHDRFAISNQEGVIIADKVGAVLRFIPKPNARWGIYAAASSDRVFGRRLNRVLAWDADSGEQVFERSALEGEDARALAVSPDGLTLCLVNLFPDGTRRTQFIDIPSGRLLSQLPVGSANCLMISPDGRWLAFDSGHDIQIYDFKRRRLAGTLRGHSGAIRNLVFSHDSQRVGSVSADRNLKLWSVPSGELLYSVIAHRTDVNSLAMSPDGRRIATVGGDSTIRLWDGKSNEALWEYPVSTGEIYDLCFSSSGQRLFCRCDRGNILILDGSPSDRGLNR